MLLKKVVNLEILLTFHLQKKKKNMSHLYPSWTRTFPRLHKQTPGVTDWNHRNCESNFLPLRWYSQALCQSSKKLVSMTDRCEYIQHFVISIYRVWTTSFCLVYIFHISVEIILVVSIRLVFNRRYHKAHIKFNELYN